MSINYPNPGMSRGFPALASSPIMHPDYAYWFPVWQMIRDAEIGEIEVKRKSSLYLPKLQGHDSDQYAAYLRRAVFFNMTAKTLNSLYGTVFRRAPKVFGLSRPLLERAKRFSKDGMSLSLTAKMAVKEVLAVGRYGLLVDASPDGRGGAYVAGYTAENILDWQLEEIEGQWKFTRVTLREIDYSREAHGFSPYRYTASYRILVLNETDEGWVYEQHVFRSNDPLGLPDPDAAPNEILIPTVRGQTLDTIPFKIIGPFNNHPGVQKPPILDIVTLNYSHYESYAQLEQGRFYTANPVYYTNVATDGEGSDYYVGPDVVWELGKDGKAGIIEFTGHGLRSLEVALKDKEAQISAIGGRMMPGSSRGAAESDNSLRMKEQNEQTLLLNLADTTDDGFTEVLRWWADWNNVARADTARITFELNRDFLLKDIGAREFRAVHQMYSDGVIPITVFFQFLQLAEVIPDWMDFDEFRKLVDDENEFPHMVDVLARMQDFPDARSMQEWKLAQEERRAASQEVRPNPDERDPVNPDLDRAA